MASSLISSSHHIDFDSVFGMGDAALVQMFESLIATGLKEFLGCPAVFYEAALTEFFTNGSVREDGMVVSTIRGTTVEISESFFATAFDLPTEGLTDLSDVPKNLLFDARSLFSESKEQDRVLGALSRDSNDQRNLLSLELQSSHKQLGTQIVTTGLDVVDVRRVVRESHQELNARINSLDEQVAATRNDLLKFSNQAQQTLNIITIQLSELVAYINRGGDNKKGESSSSRGPQPPPPPVD
ncbi:hypothetical protein F511_37865 [Dorcoceras hygrometricum]|uniref:Uncharacterized protein n=1 Tax=Dorcoceras hygrometricum TaxID=472368 RepID=A0A2Z7AK24_9LAMI|nr:hypothetical protein F511_37865 [Dorcoceras hygrometricum]